MCDYIFGEQTERAGEGQIPGRCALGDHVAEVVILHIDRLGIDVCIEVPIKYP